MTHAFSDVNLGWVGFSDVVRAVAFHKVFVCFISRVRGLWVPIEWCNALETTQYKALRLGVTPFNVDQKIPRMSCTEIFCGRRYDMFILAMCPGLGIALRMMGRFFMLCGGSWHIGC